MSFSRNVCKGINLLYLFPSGSCFGALLIKVTVLVFTLIKFNVVWVLNFWRNLLDAEISDLTNHLALLEKVCLSVDKKDERLWAPDSKGQFKVQSFFEVLQGEQPIETGWKRFWNRLVPTRVTVRLEKILTVRKDITFLWMDVRRVFFRVRMSDAFS